MTIQIREKLSWVSLLKRHCHYGQATLKERKANNYCYLDEAQRFVGSRALPPDQTPPMLNSLLVGKSRGLTTLVTGVDLVKVTLYYTRVRCPPKLGFWPVTLSVTLSSFALKWIAIRLVPCTKYGFILYCIVLYCIVLNTVYPSDVGTLWRARRVVSQKAKWKNARTWNDPESPADVWNFGFCWILRRIVPKRLSGSSWFWNLFNLGYTWLLLDC